MGLARGTAAIWLWDYDSGLEIPERAVQLARDSGALEVLALVDNVCGQAAAWGGDFEVATLLAAEVEAVKEATGSRIGPYAAISVAGLRGGSAEALPLIDARPERRQRRPAGHGRAVRALGECRRHERPRSLRGGAGLGLGGDRVHAAAVHRGLGTGRVGRSRHEERRRRRCTAGAGTTRSWTEASDADWALGVRAQARAASPRTTSRSATTGRRSTASDVQRLRPNLARAPLLYGEWLRRAARRVDAREALRTAHELFDSIGMEAFTERAGPSCSATGEQRGERSPDTRDVLTPQEQQIARLAREGLSNPEIGAQLFLSPRTVEWHLGKVFGKLGVKSRRELRTAMSNGGARSG